MLGSGRKYPSGSYKRKKKQREDEVKEALSGSLLRYYKSKTNTSRNPEELAIVLADDQNNVNRGDDGHTPTEDDVDINMHDINVSDHDPIFNSCAAESVSVDEEPVVTLDIYDSINWGSLDNKARDILVEKGPKRKEESTKYPLDETSPHFSYNHYSRKMSNGEVRNRRWLVFSKQANKVFCFCCKIFNFDKCKSALGHDDFCD
uniref:TTF-type domain-containing protein n=1 Tax=Hordeum vulgare subsp. vulgare TaxID=112509 RepID=A0A8I6WD92_HORVV